MARPSNTAERRAQIARGLMQVMAERGYDGASVHEIARAAELTQGLVHYHFKNKEEILIAALHELMAEHTARLDEALEAAGADAINQLAAFIDFHLRLGKNANPVALASWLVISGEAMRRPDVRSGFSEAIGVLTGRARDIIERGSAAALFRCSEPAAAASALVAAIQGYFVLAATARSHIPSGSAASSVKRMAEGLLSAKRPIVTRGGAA